MKRLLSFRLWFRKNKMLLERGNPFDRAIREEATTQVPGRLFLVVADSTNLVTHLRVEDLLLEGLV
jgi:hypothetical protein